jgi:hypothetical protein
VNKGRVRGAAALLRQRALTNHLLYIHCSAHLQDLADDDAKSACDWVSAFSGICDSVFELYCRSAPLHRELEAIAAEKGIRLLGLKHFYEGFGCLCFNRDDFFIICAFFI